MSMCDHCIHDYVCGLEDNHEEAITYCAEYRPMPKDKRNAFKEAGLSDGARANELCNDLNKVLGKYGLRLFTLMADETFNPLGDYDIVAIIQTKSYSEEIPHLDASVTG